MTYPNFINVIGLNLEKIYLTDEHETAEPFYTVLWLSESGNWTGEYYLEDYENLKNIMPLFISKKHPQEFIALRKDKNIGVKASEERTFKLYS